MPRELSTVDAVLQLIFAGGPSQEPEELDQLESQIEEIDSTQREERLQGPNKRPSIYVKVFEDMFNEVEGFERYLFDDSEWLLMDHISRLDYQSRYLLVRLLCRNRGRWLRYKHLEKYVSEIGQEGIRASMVTLSKKIEPPAQVIDLTGDSDDEDGPIAGPSRLPTPPPPPTLLAGLESLCADEASMPLDLILDTLDLQDLKALAKDLKIPTGTSKKREVKAALLKHARSQTILPLEPSPMKKKGKKKVDDRLTQTTLSFAVKSNRPAAESQEHRLRVLASKRLGKCISINSDLFLLVRRMCIIYYRCIHLPRDILRPSLLSEFKKRTYPSYNYKRSTIYTTRESLLEFEEALELEDRAQEILDASDDTLSSVIVKHEEKTPSLAARTPARALSQHGQLDGQDDIEADNIPELPSTLELKSLQVKRMLEETILPRWRKCVQAKKEGQDDDDLRPGLDRFEPGSIYTRLVQKGTEALGHLKEYAAEVKLLNELLDQRFWRRGKRGEWYERRALVTINYLSKTEGKKRKNNKVLREAMEGLKEALSDDDTHIVCRPGLLRRLQKLEKTLKVPEDERVQCEGELKEPIVKEVRAARVKSDPFKANQPGQMTKGKENKPLRDLAGNGGRKWGAKSVWYGDRNEEVNVETRALQDYEKVGYRGMHAETRIVTTIFGLLFWDIIFADVPGAFETKFQVAPLDIAEDSFYFARKELIDRRLKEIRCGRAVDILDRHDRTYRSSNTWCVGVRWDLCSKEDLREIVECFSGSSLATICQLFCEDYSGRSSGAPDLIVWNYEERDCKFVEVKGPGDRPMENQKLWFDALNRANVGIELCRVIDINAKMQRHNLKLKRKAQAQEVEEIEVLSGPEDAGPGEASMDEGPGEPRTPAKRKWSTVDLELDDELPLVLSQEWPASSPVIRSPPQPKRIKVEA